MIMGHHVNGCREIHDNDVKLAAAGGFSVYINCEVNQLGLARKILSEPVLVWYQDLVQREMFVDLGGYDMHHHLWANACQWYWSAIFRLVLWSFLIDWHHVGLFPVSGHFAGLIQQGEGTSFFVIQSLLFPTGLTGDGALGGQVLQLCWVWSTAGKVWIQHPLV